MISNYFQHINYLAVLACVIVNIIMGMLWYSKILFGKMWAAEMKMDMNNVDKSAAMRGYILSILSSVVAYLCLAILMNLLHISTLRGGILMGLLISIGFIKTSMVTNAGFEGKSWTLVIINGGYQIICYVIAGIILVSWK